jgi:hypothetical protein
MAPPHLYGRPGHLATTLDHSATSSHGGVERRLQAPPRRQPCLQLLERAIERSTRSLDFALDLANIRWS